MITKGHRSLFALYTIKSYKAVRYAYDRLFLNVMYKIRKRCGSWNFVEGAGVTINMFSSEERSDRLVPNLAI